MGFFDRKNVDYLNTPLMQRIEIGLIFGVWLFLGWLLTSPDAPLATGIYFSLLTVAMVAYAGKWTAGLHTIGFGKNLNNFYVASGVGILLAILMTSGAFNFINPALMEISPVIPFGLSTVLIFTGIVAPVVEESLFRGTLHPTFAEWTRNGFVAFIAQAAAFAAFHFWVSGFAPGIMPMAFIFGLIAGAGNIYFKSTGFSYALHMANNLIVIGAFG